MSEERQETVAYIVAEMRRTNPETFLFSKWCCEQLPNRMRSYADRIEAAAKREREAGAEAAQICGEIGEMVGREASCHQPVTDCHGLNAAAMREALVMVKRLFDGRLMWQTDIRKAHEALNSARSAPPRNCDACNTVDDAVELAIHIGVVDCNFGAREMAELLLSEAKGYEK